MVLKDKNYGEKNAHIFKTTTKKIKTVSILNTFSFVFTNIDRLDIFNPPPPLEIRLQNNPSEVRLRKSPFLAWY